jgi:hypothetical protein
VLGVRAVREAGAERVVAQHRAVPGERLHEGAELRALPVELDVADPPGTSTSGGPSPTVAEATRPPATWQKRTS